MQCPHCLGRMQAFQLDGLELDRCHACGQVWLDFNEVDRIYGAADLSLTEVEVDAECPRGHGVLRSGGVDEQVVEVCPTCRGVLVKEEPQRSAALASPGLQPAAGLARPGASVRAPAPAPRAKAAPAAASKPRPRQEALTVACDHCLKSVPLAEAVMSNRGLVCRHCDLEERPMTHADTVVQKVSEGLGRVLIALLDD